MVTQPARKSYRRVLMAVDLSKASADALWSAHELGMLQDAWLVVVHGFESMAQMMMLTASLDREAVQEHVDHAATEAAQSLSAFLASGPLASLPCES